MLFRSIWPLPYLKCRTSSSCPEYLSSKYNMISWNPWHEVMDSFTASFSTGCSLWLMITARHCCHGYIGITASAIAPQKTVRWVKEGNLPLLGRTTCVWTDFQTFWLHPPPCCCHPCWGKVFYTANAPKNLPVTNFSSCSWMHPRCFHAAMAQNAPTYVSGGCLQRQAGKALSLVTYFPHLGTFRYFFNSLWLI